MNRAESTAGYLLFERGFGPARYARGLRRAAPPLRDVAGDALTIALTGYLYVVIPKSFFPQQDTGQIVGITEAAQDISLPRDVERRQALVGILQKDPRHQIGSKLYRARRSTATLNQGRIFIVLKPKPGRKASADQIINRLTRELAHIRASTCTCRRPRTSPSARLSKTQYQYTLTDAVQ